MVDEYEEVLEEVNFENLSNKVKMVGDFLLEHGIVGSKTVKRLPQDSDHKLITVNEAEWLQCFQHNSTAEAFYKSINKKNDLISWSNDINEKLTKIKDDLKNFSQQNESSLNDLMQKKIEHIISLILKARKPLRVLTDNLLKELDECNDVDEMQQKIATKYVDFLRNKFFEPVVDAIYEGMKENPQDSYRYMMLRINDFIAFLGIKIVVLHAGDVMDFVNYEPTDDSAKNITHDEALKERVKAVVRYAYVFKWEKEDLLIMSGRASVWRYEQE